MTSLPTLRELIAAATPGSWKARELGEDSFLATNHWSAIDGGNERVALVEGYGERYFANAALIARCNPQTMLAVLEALEHTYTMLDALKNSSPEMHDHYKLMGKRYTEEVIGPVLQSLNTPGGVKE